MEAPLSSNLVSTGGVAVRLLQWGVRNEEVAGHGPHGLLHAGRAHASLLDQMVDQLGAQAVGGKGFDGVTVHPVDRSARRPLSSGGRGVVARSHDYLSREC